MNKTKEKKAPQRGAERNINALFTNLQGMVTPEEAHSEADFLSFALKSIKRSSGVSMRYLMCKLLDYSLRSHSDFAPQYDRLKREYEALCGINSAGRDGSSAGEAVAGGVVTP